MNNALKNIMKKYDDMVANENSSEHNFDLDAELEAYEDSHDKYDYRQILKKLEEEK